jgi:sugar/nucleoside kinase (ribokinase family)
MDAKNIIISGTGCALADFLYTNVSFTSSAFKKYRSKKDGDGGLSPGRLVFMEELEKFTGCDYKSILKEITGDKAPDGFNIGGPSLVALIHASQMLDRSAFTVCYFGTAGNDDTEKKIFSIAKKTPLNIDNYLTKKGKASPFTDVLSDPQYDNGHGERTFVNNIGAAWEYRPEFLTSDFYDSDIVCFGGTALVPRIHDDLTSVLKKSKSNGCITVVNTVFDFRNEKMNPGRPWPLGKSIESFGLIDVLIMDRDEALKICGQSTIEEAASYYAGSGVSAFIITNGANNLYAWSGGSFFMETGLLQYPVSEKVTTDLRTNPNLKGDTTGCGDNFAGGIIASIAMQLKNKKRGRFDLEEAVSWGVASGGFSCYTLGGTYIEKTPGEKLNLVSRLQQEYLKQIKK